MVSETYPELLSLALELAELAQEQILPRYLHCAVRIKGDGSEVTEADRAAEAAMRKRILERCPGHSILGEEYGPEGVAGVRFQWLLDPIDGTASFTIGVPLFGTLVGLLDQGRPVVGVIHLPGVRETVYAARGHGCWFQHGDSAPTQVTVERRATLAESVVSATAVHSSDWLSKPGQTRYRVSAYVAGAGKFRFVPDCVQHALVCRGRLQAALDTLMNPWDIAAIVPCIEEAGGLATTASGRREGVIEGGSLLTSCGGPLHDELVEILRPLPAD